MTLDLGAKIPGAPNFTWSEVFGSSTARARGINNFPTADKEQQIVSNIMFMMPYVQGARNAFNEPLVINSGYRSPALNKAVGGSATSFHSHGLAVDLTFLVSSSRMLPELLKYFHESGKYTELIAEEINEKGGGWIHFAIAPGRETEKQLKYKLTNGPVKRVSSYSELLANVAFNLS